MNRIIDLTGQKFGRLTVIELIDKRAVDGSAMWKCSCICGKTTCVRSDHLRKDETVSCGCFAKEQHTKHGYSGHPLYPIWGHLVQRCCNPDNHAFYTYGGRGITICDEWRNDPKAFIEWALANGYKKGLTIDRRNNNQGYKPQNCRFITKKEQMNNTNQLNLFLAIGPEGQIIIAKNQNEFGRRWNLNRSAISMCIRGLRKYHNGWSFEPLISREDYVNG